MSRSSWLWPDIGLYCTVSVTCAADGRAHSVRDAELAMAPNRSTGFPAVCGHVVTPVSLVEPDGELCRACAERDANHRRRRRMR